MKGTVVYYTYGNKPKAPVDYCRGILDAAARANDLRVVAGWHHPDEPPCHQTLYTQILRGLICAEGPTFLAEDDVLYPPDHFAAGLAHMAAQGVGVYYNMNVIHLGPKGYFPAGHPTFLSACCGTDIELKRAITAKLDETRASPNHCPVLAEPEANGTYRSDAPVVDVRNNRNFTGMREGPFYVQSHPYWGHAENHKVLFMEGQ